MSADETKPCRCDGCSDAMRADDSRDDVTWPDDSWSDANGDAAASAQPAAVTTTDWSDADGVDALATVGLETSHWQQSSHANLHGRCLTQMSLTWSPTGMDGMQRPTLPEGPNMAAIVTNQLTFGEQIFFCPPPPPGPCSGMHTAYDPTSAREVQAVNLLLADMARCGLPATLAAVAGTCCVSGKSHFKVTLAAGAKPNPGMERTARMIGSTKRAFCLEINTRLAMDADSYTRTPATEDSQLNPFNLNNPAYSKFRFSGNKTQYNRPPCDLLAHIISENFHGNALINGKRQYLRYERAHALAIAEENWVRRSRGKPLIQLADAKAMQIIRSHQKMISAEEKLAAGGGQGPGNPVQGGCQSASTVTCSNNCPGGRCCADPVTPPGWVSCKDICTPGSPGCPV